MSEAIVFLEITDLDTFIYELESRYIIEVRQSAWHRTEGKYLEQMRKARFTAWDPQQLMILRMDIPYYRGLYVRRGNDEEEKKIDEAITRVINPIVEKIEKVAKVENGEYHPGKTEW